MDSNNTAHLTMAKAFFGTNHPLFNMFNISVGAVSDGHAEMTMPFSEQLSDRKGSLHRGALVTLLDTTCGLSIFSSWRSLEPIATIDLRVDFLRRIPSAVGLKAIVDCIGRTDTVAFITGRAVAEDSGELLATVTGSFAIGTMGPSFDSNEARGE